MVNGTSTLLQMVGLIPLSWMRMRAMHELPKIGCLWGVPLGWAWLMLRRLKFTRLRYELIAHYVELLRHGQVKALPCELVTPASLLIEKVRILHFHSPRRWARLSRGFESPSSMFRCSVQSSPCHIVQFCDPLAELLGLISRQLSLAADKIALKLHQFLRLLHTKELVGKVERVRERLFGKQHGGFANNRRLP